MIFFEKPDKIKLVFVELMTAKKTGRTSKFKIKFVVQSEGEFGLIDTPVQIEYDAFVCPKSDFKPPVCLLYDDAETEMPEPYGQEYTRLEELMWKMAYLAHLPEAVTADAVSDLWQLPTNIRKPVIDKLVKLQAVRKVTRFKADNFGLKCRYSTAGTTYKYQHFDNKLDEDAAAMKLTFERSIEAVEIFQEIEQEVFNILVQGACAEFETIEVEF